MRPIDIPAIERRARELRAQEMRRLEGLVAERARLYLVLLGGSLLSLAEAVKAGLFPLFSWNPRAASRAAGPSWGIRLNRLVRGLFAWNPRRRAC